MESNWPFAVSKSTNHFCGKQNFRLTPPSVLLRCTIEFRQLGPMRRDGTRVIQVSLKKCAEAMFFSDSVIWRKILRENVSYEVYVVLTRRFPNIFPSSKLLASKRKKLHDRWNQVVFLKMFPSKMDEVGGLFFNSGCFFEDLFRLKNHPQLWEMWTLIPYKSRMRHEFRCHVRCHRYFPFHIDFNQFHIVYLSVQSLASAEGSSCRCTWSTVYDPSKMIKGIHKKKQTKSQKDHNQNQAWKPHRNFQKNDNPSKKKHNPNKKDFGNSLFWALSVFLRLHQKFPRTFTGGISVPKGAKLLKLLRFRCLNLRASEDDFSVVVFLGVENSDMEK